MGRTQTVKGNRSPSRSASCSRSRSGSRSRRESADGKKKDGDRTESSQPAPAAPKGPVCFKFLAGKCQNEDCPNRHPDDTAMKEKMKSTPCALGANCRRKDCFYKHPDKK